LSIGSELVPSPQNCNGNLGQNGRNKNSEKALLSHEIQYMYKYATEYKILFPKQNVDRSIYLLIRQSSNVMVAKVSGIWLIVIVGLGIGGSILAGILWLREISKDDPNQIASNNCLCHSSLPRWIDV
jgi:hypothetical protein